MLRPRELGIVGLRDEGGSVSRGLRQGERVMSNCGLLGE